MQNINTQITPNWFPLITETNANPLIAEFCMLVFHFR